MARLVVISNRVGLPDRNARAGGLEVAIRGALSRERGMWFGWSGKVATPGAPRVTEHDGISYVTVDLSRLDYQEFYNGFANSVLWPVLHYRLDLVEFNRRDQGGYERVNEFFARQVERFLRPDDVVWVHDYHLIPLAKALRHRGFKNKIGFFLHIPFPPPEVVTALPNHERLFPALCHYDLVGFQTANDSANFARYLASECGLAWANGNSFWFGERTVSIGNFPVGVDPTTFARLAKRAAASKFVKDVVGSLSGRSLIIGVDRLDYSKGLPLRLDAFERFLANHEDWRGKATYLQITPHSRSDVAEYAQIIRRVDETVGRINGAYGEANWTPLRYLNKAHSRTALAGLYHEARVGLVTPLRDGMNLVAKEYVAAQNPDDPGVLVLSRFAGAAQELRQALLVNPYDTEGVGNAIKRALAMPLDERRERHQAMLKTLANSTPDVWTGNFLARLKSPEGDVGAMPLAGPLLPAEKPQIAARR